MRRFGAPPQANFYNLGYLGYPPQGGYSGKRKYVARHYPRIGCIKNIFFGFLCLFLGSVVQGRNRERIVARGRARCPLGTMRPEGGPGRPRGAQEGGEHYGKFAGRRAQTLWGTLRDY